MTYAITLSKRDQEQMGRDVVYELEGSLREAVQAVSGVTDAEIDTVRGKQLLHRAGARLWNFGKLLFWLAVLMVSIRIMVYVAVWAWGLV